MFGIKLNRKNLLFLLVIVIVYSFHRVNDIRYLSNNHKIILGSHLLLTLYLIHTHRHNENFQKSVKRFIKF